MPGTNGIGGATFDQNRKWGVEIEAYNCPADVVANAITAAGVECHVESYNHNRRAAWKIVSDGSIVGQNPFELVSPPLKGAEGFRQLEIVCRVLKEQGVKVNRSTGLHVHHDASDLDVNNIKSVVTMWWKYEDVLVYFLPPSRRANMYCKPAMARANVGQGYRWTPGTDPVAGWKAALDQIRNRSEISGDYNQFQPDRYAPVNCHALSRHGTLEFRSHAGTTEFAKIHAWIVLTQWFLTRSKAKGCHVRTRMTGRWAEDVRYFWRAIDWVYVEDAEVVKAKNHLRKRFNHFKDAERGPRTEDARPLHRVDEAGRIRPTAAAGDMEEGQ